ncbi:DJ-1 [Pleomassaria siparia CBS 279.74]|uniref:D-lactate dehydratase n=1 Tax=Pleomassaria siparia CBS 279.74 TaxID=1314801 RepID=A0A6G1K6Y7_9PLEO|nr:DJ-1 [Pleomassaria siparia CBS 279.74]
MPKALILLADGNEEIEFVSAYDVLTRAEFEVKSVGVSLKIEKYARMSRSVRIVPDILLTTSLVETGPKVYDMLVIPGGAMGAATFCANDEVLQLIANFRTKGKWVAAICAATTALVAARNKFGGDKVLVTSHPSVKHKVQEEEGWEYSEDGVVVDGKIITSRGPGFSIAFALKMVELLQGVEKRNAVAGPMMLPE